MNLTAEGYESLCATLEKSGRNFQPSSSGGGSGRERRKHVRVGARFSVRMIQFAAGKPVKPQQVHVRDISVHGVSVLQKAPMRPGQRFVLELPREFSGTLRLLFEVRNCRNLGDQLYGIGSYLLAKKNIDNPSDDSALLDSSSAQSPAIPPAANLELAAAKPNSAGGNIDDAGLPLAEDVLNLRAAEIRKTMFGDD